MADREKIIRFYKGTEGEEIVIKLIDAVEAVNKTRKFRANNCKYRKSFCTDSAIISFVILSLIYTRI